MMNSLLSSRLYSNDTFYSSFTKDLRNAKHSVVIESPFITAKRMNVLFPIISKLRQDGVLVVVNTRNPDEHDAEFSSQASQAVALMQNIGVVVLYTVKHHRKLAIIDNKILWEGSLNILSQNDSCEIMRRIVSQELSWQMAKFISVEKYLLSPSSLA